MSIKNGGNSFETLNQKIYAGTTQIKRIYAGSSMVYPIRINGLRCFIDHYPKMEYYTGETYDWGLLKIIAEYEDYTVEDVTDKFTILPAHGEHCKKVGEFLVKCTWETEEETYVLYFKARGIPREYVWIDREPHLLYVRGQAIDWGRLIVLASDGNGIISDVTNLVGANPAHGSAARTPNNTDNYNYIPIREARFSLTVDGKYNSFTLNYKVSPDKLYRYDHIKDHSDLPDWDETTRLGKFIMLTGGLADGYFSIIEMTRSPLTSDPQNYLWIVDDYNPYYILQGFNTWDLSRFYDKYLELQELPFVRFRNPPNTKNVYRGNLWSSHFPTANIAGTATYMNIERKDPSRRTRAILPEWYYDD